VTGPIPAYDDGPVAGGRGSEMKKILIVLILVAIGVAVAKKVREA
jgi:hypothetical protein